MACETKAGVVELWFVNPDWTDGGLSAVWAGGSACPFSCEDCSRPCL